MANDHAAGEGAGIEFIRYRWYADALLDNIFWHDHVDGIHGWGHGGVGMLIIEPRNSTYHDPTTGAEVASGTVVDIHSHPEVDGIAHPLAAGLRRGQLPRDGDLDAGRQPGDRLDDQPSRRAVQRSRHRPVGAVQLLQVGRPGHTAAARLSR